MISWSEASLDKFNTSYGSRLSTVPEGPTVFVLAMNSLFFSVFMCVCMYIQGDFFENWYWSIPLFLYGGVSTGKTTTVLQIFRHLRRPFVYVSCRTCYSPRILFETIINQLLLHSKNEGNGYSSAKRCEKPSDFVNYLRDALLNVISGFKEKMEKSSSKKSLKWVKGSIVYVIIDNLELVRDWDKSLSILPFLYKLYDRSF